MTPTIIETKYNGYNFRSRTEARWAVFFDALGVHYEYEPEGFKLPNGEYYLPDFYLPHFGGGGYFEVKPLIDNKPEWMTKLEMLAKMTGKNSFILNGPPDFRYYGKFDPRCSEEWNCERFTLPQCTCDRKCDHELVPHGWCSIIFCGGDSNYLNEDGYYVDPVDFIGSEIGKHGFLDCEPSDVYWEKYIQAVYMSRAERFAKK